MGVKKISGVVSDVIKRVLMVPPTHFTVEYSINPWMGGIVNKQKAMEQWLQLKTEIEKEFVEVITLDQVKGLPDMVFSCNSGIVYGNKVYLSKYRNIQRAGEQRPFAEWFKHNGFEIFGDTYPAYFEGGGDAVFSDYNTLWAGYGFRTNKEVYDHIAKLGDFQIILCELIDPNFYHIDTCFCPIGDSSALWYPKAFDDSTQLKIKKRLPNAIEVTNDEARAFVCNAIAIRKKVISPVGVSQTTRDELTRLGYTIWDRIRGGMVNAVKRYSKANNKYMKDYNPDEASKYLMYLDANNLYGWAMIQKLPHDELRFEMNKENLGLPAIFLDTSIIVDFISNI